MEQAPIDAARQRRTPSFENVRARDPHFPQRMPIDFHMDALPADDNLNATAKGRSALDALWQAHEKMMEAGHQVADKKKLADAIKPEVAKVAKRIKSEVDGLEAQIKHHDSEIRTAIGSGLGGHTSEIRAHIKSLPEAERSRFLHLAIDAGNADVIKAVFAAPAFLSGLDENETYFTLLSMAHEVVAPKAALERRTAMNAAERATRALSHFETAWNRALTSWASSDDARVADLLKALNPKKEGE